MAALRIFARNAIAEIRSSRLTGHSWKDTRSIVQQVQKRWVTIKVGTGLKEKEVELADFEASRDPKEWSYVEWTLQDKIIPKPPAEEKVYPSGWKPQSQKAKSLPYFVERTRNHMMPVYLRTHHRGMKKVTHIRRIQGDIMLLEKEMRKYLQEIAKKQIGSQINEPAGLIKYRGDYVNLCRMFLDAKGF